MRTGPFSALGKWPVFAHDGSRPCTGAGSSVVIVRATKKYVKYTRRCASYDPKGERVRHGKVIRWDAGTFRVSVGGFQHIQAAARYKRSMPSISTAMSAGRPADNESIRL